MDKQVWGYEVFHATIHAKEEGCRFPKLKGWLQAMAHVCWHPLVCKVKGHKWEVIGECTPNHGYYGKECSRCGEAHGETIH